MKNILKIIPALVFAFSTCAAVAQTSGSNSTTQQKNKTGNTNSKSATRVETVVGSPTRADDQMNQGNPGNPENKATSTQAGNNRAVESVNKKGTTTTKGTKTKAKAATGTTGSIDMQGNNRAGGMDATTTNIAAKYENDMTQMVTKLQLIFDKMQYMDQKVDLMNSVMMKEKKSRAVREQLQELTAQINALDNQIDAADSGMMGMQGTNNTVDHVTANIMPKYENEMTHMVSLMQLMQNRMQYMNQKMDLMNSVMMKDKKAKDVRAQLQALDEKINAVNYQMKAVDITNIK